MNIATLNYVIGDATRPEGDGPRVLAHCCNNFGHWGKGFVLEVSKRWESPERMYRLWERSGITDGGIRFALGNTQFVNVGRDPADPKDRQVWVANMLSQKGIQTRTNPYPICCDSLRKCFGKVCDFCMMFNASVHLPKIGCSFGGGSWEEIEPIIQCELVHKGINVTVYTLGDV